MSAKNQFDWIAFYEEFADKLLAYKDNRQELIEKIKQVYEVTGIKLPTLERNENGDNEIVDIDPFTTFGLFNKGITNANRVKIITAIKDLFEVSSPVPTYFDGIPVLNNQMATFYWFGNGRGEHDIDNLWDVFDYAIALSKSDSPELREKFSDSFNTSLSQKGVKWNLSMGLYWIRPNRFLNLDSRNRWFIINNDSLPESVVAKVKNLKSMPEAEAYLAICDECLSYIHSDKSPYDSLSALSFSAWNVSKQDDGYEKLTEDSSSNSGAKFLRWFKPLLQALKDLGGSATPKEARNKIIENEKLTEEETSAVVGKTQTPEFNNDVAWARQYLVRGGYLDNSTRGVWKLTESGWSVNMTDELASEIFKTIVKENQQDKEDKGSALADEDVNTKRYWIFSPGNNASKWSECTEKGIMLIGWGEIGDLTRFTSKSEMKAAMQDTYGDNKPYRNAALATWQFANEMKPGDIVFAKQGMYKIIGRGVVESGYMFDDSSDDEYNNIRKVKWTDIGEWEHPGQAAMKTLTDITQYTEYVETLNAMFDTEDDDDDIEVDETPLNTYTKENFLADVYISEKQYDTLEGLLLKKLNVILQGAPGVGKTYAAKRLAYSMMGVKDPERVQLVQFHQSYSYEDFVEGFRPSSTGMNFEIKKGAFYNFCKKASDDKENEYFFIIDEINRGNLSKIFGELFMLIEADKRGNDIQLLYSSDKFSVPKNVYIIGMMNTADRSLAMIDYALRRRFAFFEMKPAFESEGFREYQYGLESDKFNKLIDCVISLNQRIADDESLGEGFCIGHSYFCDIEEIKENTLTDIVEFEIIPLLKEYWFDEPSKVKEWSDRLRSAVK
ncbi:MAG: winged helix-turn-helix domain-containing protein [Clostridia bacterium]|nr:winged helix-turn-helix domain-containing protein [Clostridia bacterium]